MYWFIKIGLRKWNFFGAKEFFYMIFDFKNGCKNEFKDNNEKSCKWARKRVSRKIDFKVQWLRNSHVDSVGVKCKNFVGFLPSLLKIVQNFDAPVGINGFFWFSTLGLNLTPIPEWKWARRSWWKNCMLWSWPQIYASTRCSRSKGSRIVINSGLVRLNPTFTRIW